MTVYMLMQSLISTWQVMVDLGLVAIVYETLKQQLSQQLGAGMQVRMQGLADQGLRDVDSASAQQQSLALGGGFPNSLLSQMWLEACLAAPPLPHRAP